MNGQTDNQQRKVSDIAWLCGFLDGEGSVGLKVQKYMRGKKVFYVAPYIQLVNTHKPTLDKIDGLLTEMGIGHYIDWPKPRKIGSGNRKLSEYKPLWRVLINGLKRCKPMLHATMPYLVTKLDDAKLVMEFIESRESSHYKQLPYTQKELSIINKFRRVRRSGKVGEAISLESLNDYTQDTQKREGIVSSA